MTYPTKNKPGAGRPSLYKPKFAKEVLKLCKNGASDSDIADHFKVDLRTVRNWRIKFPKFLQNSVIGTEAAVTRVEQSLIQKSIGYSFDTEKIMVVKGKIVKVPTREHLPPDTPSIKFYLTNRDPSRWTDQNETMVNLQGELTVHEPSRLEAARHVAFLLSSASFEIDAVAEADTIETTTETDTENATK